MLAWYSCLKLNLGENLHFYSHKQFIMYTSPLLYLQCTVQLLQKLTCQCQCIQRSTTYSEAGDSLLSWLSYIELTLAQSVSTSTNTGSPRAQVTGHRSDTLKYYSFAGPMRGKPTGGFPIPVHAITALSLHRSCTRHKCLIPL